MHGLLYGSLMAAEKSYEDIHKVLYALNALHRMNVDTLIMSRVLPSYLSLVTFCPHLLHIFIYLSTLRVLGASRKIERSDK
jgi:hypothetical protein